MGLIQKAFSDIITFSRSSNATRIGPTGRVEYAPHNLLQRSQEFDNAYWTKNNASIVANAFTAPDGSVTADALVEDTTSGLHRIYVNITLISTVQYTSSVYVKANGRSWVYVRTDSATGIQAWFNVSTGVVGTVGSGLSASIQNVGNGWYRCSITLTAIPTNNFLIGLADADNSTSYTGNGTGGVYLWGAQLSVGSVPGDYTPTTSAAVYGPRFDFDPVTLAARGLLIEEQRTNSLTYSEDFTNAAWTKGGSTITANAATAPDGTVTADKLVEDSSTGNHWVFQNFSNTNTTLSVFAKAAERSYVGLAAAGQGLCFFNLSNGTIVSTAANCVTSIISVGNGWYRCSVAATGTGSFAIIGASADGTTVNYTGNGSSGIFIWGAQLEAGAFATSYIPTLASTVTRSADVASVNTLSPWFNATEGTLFVDYTASGSSYPAVLYTDANNHIDLIAGTSGAAFDVTSSGSSQASIGTRALTAKVAARFKSNDFAVSVNGGTVVTDTSGTVPSITDRLSLGSFPSVGLYINGRLRRLAFYPRALANAELQALTA